MYINWALRWWWAFTSIPPVPVTKLLPTAITGRGTRSGSTTSLFSLGTGIVIIPKNSREQRWPDFDMTWQNLLMRSTRKQCIVQPTKTALASAVVKILE